MTATPPKKSDEKKPRTADQIRRTYELDMLALSFPKIERRHLVRHLIKLAYEQARAERIAGTSATMR